MQPRSIDTIGFPLRADKRCISCATTSFPEPFSPVMSMFASVGAMCVMRLLSSRICADSPMNLDSRRGVAFSSCSSSFVAGIILLRLRSTAECIVSIIFLFSQGLGTKSTAPAFIARTVFSVLTYAVMNMTTLAGSCSSMRASHSYPSSPLILSLLKFMSSRITSGWKLSMNSIIRPGSVMTLMASVHGRNSMLNDRSTSSLSSTINIFPLHFIVCS